MKRLAILFIGAIAVLCIGAVAILPVGVSDAAGHARAARAAKLQLRHTELGNILVNGGGLTVYAFTRDSHNHDRCVTISGCTSIWPLVSTSGNPRLGPGVRRSLVRAIKLPGGARQLTYAGHPLYTYIGASGPGDISYVGLSQFGGRWLALTAAGRTVK